MNLSEAAEEFYLDVVIGNLSEHSLRTYREVVGALVRAYPDSEIDEIDAKTMRHYMADLWKRHRAGELSAHTIGKHDRHLRVFFNFCVNFRLLEHSPMDALRRPKLPKLRPQGIDPHDLVKLLKQCDQLDQYEGRRNKAILLFLADTGCRRGGLVSLRLSDLNLIKKRAVVVEKGKKSRTVYFSFYTAQHLQRWLDVRQSDSDAVFVSIRNGDPLKESGYNQLIKRMKKAAGIRRPVSPQRFRSGFARAFVEAGGDISVLARLLGHEDVRVTADYYAIFDEDELARLHRDRDVLRRMLDAGK